jgi:preprotein translocase subunit YajC
MLRELKQGDEVITIGGIYGKIEGIRDKDNSLILRIAKDVKINVSRSAIADKVSGRETSF